ncbi:hypothetical protein ACFWIW_24550 [Amycolatopsis sp. NPDC058340]|uniref:hypothetical protein n=1 Tax=Amycolatopsis sp. NPDC058340 TaxID=3346453 RepID=UPI003667457F
MTEPDKPDDPPQDTGAPEPVETDPAALNNAEDLDEDRLRADPLEQGMNPPEHSSGVDKYGVTPWEQTHPVPLAERLAEEEPDPAAAADPGSGTGADSRGVAPTLIDDRVETGQRYEENLGIDADVAGGSTADEIRTPRHER